MVSGRAFYIPGEVGASWNTTSPPVRLLVRKDMFHAVQHGTHDRLRRGYVFPETMEPLSMGSAYSMPAYMHPLAHTKMLHGSHMPMVPL